MPIMSSVYSARAYQKPMTVVSGGTLTQDANYFYRTFTSSGTLSIGGDRVTMDYLVVGGGGGGGKDRGGGGGGGGFLSGSASITGDHVVIVGAGGAADNSGDGTNPPTTGSNTDAISLASMISYSSKQNFMLNPTIDTNADHWLTYNGNTLAYTNTVSYQGTGCLIMTCANSSMAEGYQGLNFTSPLVAGQWYTYSAYFRNGTANRSARVSAWVNYPTYPFYGNSVTPVGSEWLRSSVTFQVPAGGITLGLNFDFAAGSTGTMYADAFMIEPGQVLNDFATNESISAATPSGQARILALGGGKGGIWAQNYTTSAGAGKNGGSGGGGGGADSVAAGIAGLGTSGQGNNGGAGRVAAGSATAGGGGGAGAAGQAAQVGVGGAGGAGKQWSVNGQFYGGGGGGGADNGTGGAGGSGGGAAGASKTTNAVNATINTGGGGGGGALDRPSITFRTPSNGGSGIVIIRYPKAGVFT